MNQRENYHRQNLFDSRDLIPSRHWKMALIHMLLLFLAVFITEISSAHADGLFDFQMKLAEKGNAEAQFKIGEMYETGFGVEKDMALANEWITKAARQGHETAGFKLLYWDMKKNGLTADNKPKFAELKTKASTDNGYAQYYLGKLYADGAGVNKDSEKALDLFNKATLTGIVEAEREAIAVREAAKRVQLARQLAEQQRLKELQAQEEAEKQRLEAEAEQKKTEAERAAKQSEDKRKQDSIKASNEKKLEEEEKARLAAAARAAEEREREAKRQAILKEREEREKKRKAEFESDPCSGKSARFLSTCR